MKKVFEAMQAHIQKTDISTRDTPVGISFSAGGKVLVKMSLTDGYCYNTIDEAIKCIIDLLHERSAINIEDIATIEAINNLVFDDENKEI